MSSTTPTVFYQRSKNFSILQVLHAFIISILKSALFMVSIILLRTFFGVEFYETMNDLVILCGLYFVFNLVTIGAQSVRSIRISERRLEIKQLFGTQDIGLSEAVTLRMIQPSWRTALVGVYSEGFSVTFRDSRGLRKTLSADLQQFENAEELRRILELIIAGRATPAPMGV